ncbi:uncharacterized protein LOC115744054 isoform X1 [Rhodamnia argentea]|uniref:Uncharacterized protein LOC115744054 isoform X1 n=1 Tax=Rhodamnia argentea TaxID=178133 RepID=A0A8B8PLF1_9MYRT|nr:uncharacterized protein LOC115744054 isoform X1 [Rhodamnia argentea]
MTGKFCSMVLRINIDCNGCFRKVQRALLQIRGNPSFELLERNHTRFRNVYPLLMGILITGMDTHLIEEKQCRVIVCGKFVPQDVAITLRKKTNRRVEILDVQELRHGGENEEGEGGEDAQISVPERGPVPNQKQILGL